MSDVVRQAIRASGLSLGELSRRSGLSKAALSRILSRQREPALSTVDALAPVLGLRLVVDAPDKTKRRKARKDGEA